MEVVDIRKALAEVPELAIGEEQVAERPELLAAFNDGGIFAGRFTGTSAWERHESGDELLHVLEGEIEMTVMTNEGPRDATIGAGAIFVVPRGLWHRQNARGGATLLTATPNATEVSFADDPR